RRAACDLVASKPWLMLRRCANGKPSSRQQRDGRCANAFATRSFTPTSRFSTMRDFVPSTPTPSIALGAKRTCPAGWGMAAKFEYTQAEEIRDAFARHAVRYLFIGKSGAILLGFPDTTQDADLFVEKSAANGDAAVLALRDLGFQLTEPQVEEIRRG